MSTKIYNGFRLNCNSFGGLQNFYTSLGQDIIKIKEETAKKIQADICTHIIDSVDMGYWPLEKEYEKLVPTDYPLLFSIRAIKDEKYKEMLDFEISIHFLPDKILSLLFCNNQDMINIFKSQKEVEEYGYWDNTDKPENISDHEWVKRRKDWELALGGNGWSTPSESGLLFKPERAGGYGCLDYNEILEYIQPKEVRVEKNAHLSVTAWWFEKHADTIKSLSSFIFFKKTDEYKRLKKYQANKLNYRLRDITKKDLLTNLNEL
jgi:hypothetical protein